MNRRFELPPPDLSDLPQVLKQCGVAVVKEVTRSVMEQRKPDGTAQKRNAISTIVKKGHDHPVAEKRFRFAKVSTYLITPYEKDSVRISIPNPEDSNVAAHLHEQGYDFFGITDQAEEEAFDIMDTYLQQKVREAFGNDA